MEPTGDGVRGVNSRTLRCVESSSACGRSSAAPAAGRARSQAGWNEGTAPRPPGSVRGTAALRGGRAKPGSQGVGRPHFCEYKGDGAVQFVHHEKSRIRSLPCTRPSGKYSFLGLFSVLCFPISGVGTCHVANTFIPVCLPPGPPGPQGLAPLPAPHGVRLSHTPASEWHQVLGGSEWKTGESLWKSQLRSTVRYQYIQNYQNVEFSG